MLNSHRNRLLLSWNQSNFFPCRATSFGKGQRSIWTWARQCVFWLARFTRNGPIRFGLTIHIFTRKMASWYVFVAKWCDQTTFFFTMYFPIGWPKCLKRAKEKSSVIQHVVSSCDRMFFAVITENSVTLWYSKVSSVNTSASECTQIADSSAPLNLPLNCLLILSLGWHCFLAYLLCGYIVLLIHLCYSNIVEIPVW